jgi:hypothetical protein
MTLSRYTPEMLDSMALRLLDVSASIRGMAEYVRSHKIQEVEVHDKKLLEWCEKIECWTDKTSSQLPVQVRAIIALNSKNNAHNVD